MEPHYRIAADIGGTFTDIACLSADGVLVTAKVPSTPHDYALGILTGVRQIAAQLQAPASAFGQLLHASTIATNAILEAKGARTGLVTTEGFRDVLELRRIRVPRLYEPLYQKPEPLVPRRLRLEVRERLDARGDVIQALDEENVRTVAKTLAKAGVEAVAVCFLHSYVNPEHEKQAERILREELPEDCFISVSYDVLPEVREYERTSTTVVNAYVGPVVSRYLKGLVQTLQNAGFDGRLLMMQSSGGLLDVSQVIARPATVVESGPAAGVVGAARLGHVAGYSDIITFDMGGTTAKASLIQDSRLTATDDYEVGGGISMSSALAKGGGYALKLPIIDVSEVGAGGGSVVRIDAGGGLKIGPESMGAMPGPACYGHGGTQATVTDANLVLGYLNPHALASGTVPVNAQCARDALQAAVCDKTDMSLLEAAYGVHCVANATMMRAVKAVSTYRGRNPRDFTMLAFGGNGGMHAALLARELNIGRVIVPPGAGVFSAVGLLFADYEMGRTIAYAAPLPAGEEARRALEAAYHALQSALCSEMGEDDNAGLTITRFAQLRYQGQGYELSVPLSSATVTADVIKQAAQDFMAEHKRSYGYVHDNGHMELVSIRVVASRPPARPPEINKVIAGGHLAEESTRMAYFGAQHGLLSTPVLHRYLLNDKPRQGPMIIEEYEGTTIVPPDCMVWRDAYNNVVIDLPEQGGA
ncbi:MULTISPECIES: hydantoinase/oxoprolinase family protein [Acetobacter]|uniref:hydantoinase/oxoprolinase family protein n=1 Tax=Acetobacter TaxID=434 RepID=UPI000A3790E1|nr:MULTISPECIES: hydantoinase/oxoprolinase family protein [Acetobacter]MBS0979621.1 hydantoinase/oxoprolinase family protein [Acetobacter thailandicus]OUJ12081.1 hydantoinase [Acetobacter sp. DsW_059]